MNPIKPSPVRSTRVVLTIAVVVLALLAPHASAADAVLPAVLPALDMMDVVHDRARLIQFSIAAVALGIAMLWWGNKTN
jgi:hypothetical protein